jgi:pimeloyl-ACP methyl ester carboxylesterase
MSATMAEASFNQHGPKLEWQGGRAKANGIEIEWQQAGPAHGDPVLLVMGLSWQLIHWPEAFCADLVARGLRVIRFDNRDAGLSSEVNRRVRFNIPADSMRMRFGLPVASNYLLQDLAADTLGLMDAIELPRAHLVGVSMGGMISQLAAGMAPKRAASLTSIMSSTNHPWLSGPTWPVMRQAFLSKPKDLSRDTIVARDMALRTLIGSPAWPMPEADKRAIAEAAYDRAFRPAGTLRQTHAIIATGSIHSVLPAITAPTQIIHGSADPLVQPSGGRRCAKLIRNARFELIEGMGHDLPRPLMPRIAGLIADNITRV